MAIPKLALIPSGVKAGKLYSVLPTNGDGDFTTTRNTVATRVNENGLIEEVASNVPRLDYSDGGCPSLLLEPSSTNLVTYSEDFSNVAWTKALTGVASAPVVTANQGISPDGTLNADRIVFDLNGGASSGDGSIIQQVITLTGINVNTRSVYLKSNTNLSYDIILGTNTANSSAEKITVTTEWQRFEVTQTPTTTATNFYLGLRNAFGFSGLSDSADVLVYGASLEENSYATSYIKTVGTTQTRVADTASKTGLSSLIGQSEGVLFVDFIPKDTATQIVYQIRTSGSTNVGQIDIRLTGGTINTLGNDGGSAQFNITGHSFNVGTRYKCAIRYKQNDVAFYINGVLIGTDVVASFNSSSKDQVSFGENITSFVARAGIKDARVYTTALTDIEIEKLTSWASFSEMANALNYTII